MSLQNLAFTIAEYTARVARAQAAMETAGLDAFLVNHRADVCYLTGIETGYMVAYHAAIVPAAGRPIIVASDFEMLNARVGAWTPERESFPVANADPIAETCRILAARGFGHKRIGVQRSTLTATRFDALRQHLPGAEFLDASHLMDSLKVKKSPAEIAYLRQAASLTAQAMDAALRACAADATDNDIAAVAFDAAVRGGSEFMCIDPIVTVGARSGIPHSTFRRTAIKPGDAIFIEIGACICRYSTPQMRTAAIAPVPDAIRRSANACRDSLNVLIEEMKPGAVGREIAQKARQAWRAISEELIWHGYYAYSVGIGFPPDWNDTPAAITVDSDLVLEPGMCFHATTSLRQAGEYGTAMSETVLITETGREVLTLTPRELVVKGGS
ncbi:MAG: aminopeptidase P family protein [Lentisphaerae bacterium]|nr:aminopeptidase P family protein [Lentisphaerota bacterium]